MFTSAFDECTSGSLRLLDICIVPVQINATWKAAWNDCDSRSARLLELPNTTYGNAYLSLTAAYFASTDSRWSGFTHNTSAALRYWYHGGVVDNMQSSISVASSVDPYPLCGVMIRVGTSRIVWTE